MPGKEKLLTESELELMAVLWRLGEGGVTEVMAELPKERAYTTVSTILRILEQKEFVRARKQGRGHVYTPTLSKETYEARSVKHMVQNVFAGESLGLAKHLLKEGEFAAAEISEIRALLDSLEGKKKP